MPRSTKSALAREGLATALTGKTDEVAQITQERDQARHEAATLSDACQAKTEETTRFAQEASAATLRAEAAEARIEEFVQRASVDQTKMEAANALLEEERQAREASARPVSSKNDEVTRVTQERDQRPAGNRRFARRL